MKCKIDGCDRDAMYLQQQVCQMHYFRNMRYGTYELTKKGKCKKRLITPNGYVRLHDPEHPLSVQNYVFEHRKVAYEKYGPELSNCELCGQKITWVNAHIDHIDNNKINNDPENLRAVCNPCNTRRNYPEQINLPNRVVLTINGISKTANEWAREPGCNVSRSTIIRRKKNGASDYEAVYGEKKTHQNSMKQPYKPSIWRQNTTI